MEKPRNYDETQVFTGGRKLPAGGYICKIMDVKEAKSRSNLNMIVISLDIAEGEYKDFYAEKYKTDTRKEKKWSCVVYQLAEDGDGNCNRGFKGFVTSVEESNKGFSVEWGKEFCNSLKGKLIGGLFGEEEFLAKDDTIATAIKCRFFRSVDTIKNGDFEIPEIKLYGNTKKNEYTVETNVSDDDLPF